MAYWNGNTWASEPVAAAPDTRTPSLSRRIKPAAFVALLALTVATGSVFAAKGGPAASGQITVAGPVSHGQTTMATVNPGGTDVYVFTQCWTADGTYVYAAYSPVAAD